VLAGRVYRYSQGFLRHPNCDCVMLPTTVAAPDLVQDPVELAKAGQIRGLSQADMLAIEQGADFGQVVNVRLRKAGLRQAGKVLARRGKPTPEGIYAAAGEDRDAKPCAAEASDICSNHSGGCHAVWICRGLGLRCPAVPDPARRAGRHPPRLSTRHLPSRKASGHSATEATPCRKRQPKAHHGRDCRPDVCRHLDRDHLRNGGLRNGGRRQVLGDAGKKALDAMKAKWKDADKLAKENAATMAAHSRRSSTARKPSTPQNRPSAETEQAALAKANDRILRSEVKAAAKGVLADPADAYKFLDLDSFEVDDDGEVDDRASRLRSTTSSRPSPTSPCKTASGSRVAQTAGLARSPARRNCPRPMSSD
jgi:hypothetical protein